MKSSFLKINSINLLQSDARGRLHTAVGQLLELMERSTCQLMDAKSTQQELLDTLASRAREVDSASTKCTELDAQLAAEIEAKEYLGLELHKAEGLHLIEIKRYILYFCLPFFQTFVFALY